MNKQVEKTKENSNKLFSNTTAQKKSSEKQGMDFKDNRPEAVSQRKLQAVVKNSISNQ